MSGLSYNNEPNEPCEELINGAWVAMSPRPLTNHVICAGNIARVFGVFLKGKKCISLSEIEVRLDEDNIFIPDVVILCDRSKLGRNGINGAPDLVVEVLSSGTQKRDKTYKKAVYEKFGVKEYWIVSPEERIIDVFCLNDGVFVLNESYAEYSEHELSRMKQPEKDMVIGAFPVSFLPDLTVTVADVFEDLI